MTVTTLRDLEAGEPAGSPAAAGNRNSQAEAFRDVPGPNGNAEGCWHCVKQWHKGVPLVTIMLLQFFALAQLVSFSAQTRLRLMLAPLSAFDKACLWQFVSYPLVVDNPLSYLIGLAIIYRTLRDLEDRRGSAYTFFAFLVGVIFSGLVYAGIWRGLFWLSQGYVQNPNFFLNFFVFRTGGSFGLFPTAFFLWALNATHRRKEERDSSMCFGSLSARHHPWICLLFWQVIHILGSVSNASFILDDAIACGLGYLLGFAGSAICCCLIPTSSCLRKFFCGCCTGSVRWKSVSDSTDAPLTARAATARDFE